MEGGEGGWEGARWVKSQRQSKATIKTQTAVLFVQ